MTNWLVGHGELTEVIADHVSFDFDGVPVLSRVNFADGTDHLWHDDGISQMSLDGFGLLSVRSVFHGFGKLLDQSIVSLVNATSESALLSGTEHSHDLSSAHFEELVELNTSVDLLFEWFSFGSCGRLGSFKFFLDRGHI